MSDMKTRFQDVFWILVASLVIFTLFVSVLLVFGGHGDPILALIGVIPGAWLALGCWRRTKWGAPDGGLRFEQERRATGGVYGNDEPPTV